MLEKLVFLPKEKPVKYNFFNFSMMGAMQELCQFKGKNLYQTLNP